MRTNRYRRGPRLAAAGLAIAAAAALLQLAAAAPAPAATTPFLTVGLGDSVPSGSACHCTSYVVQLGNTLARRAGRPASVANLATGGQTSGGLLVQLQRAPVRSLIARADVVVIEVGANDFDESIVATSLCRDIASSHAGGFSNWGEWPASGMTASSAPGIVATMASTASMKV